MNILGTGLFSGDDEKNRWKRTPILFLQEKGGWCSLKNGEKKKKGGNEITIVNLDTILIPEIGWFWQNWLQALFLYFSLVPGIEKRDLCLEIGVGGKPHLGWAELPAPHHGPNPARKSQQCCCPPGLWIIDLTRIKYRHFSGSAGRARGRCARWGVEGAGLRERRIWEGKSFHHHQFS